MGGVATPPMGLVSHEEGTVGNTPVGPGKTTP